MPVGNFSILPELAAHAHSSRTSDATSTDEIAAEPQRQRDLENFSSVPLWLEQILDIEHYRNRLYFKMQ